MKTFWMIWNEGNRAPVVQHWSYDAARVEAERLARENPGGIFHLLHCVGSCRKIDIEWQSDPDDEIAF